jgi:hypothetical protein
MDKDLIEMINDVNDLASPAKALPKSTLEDADIQRKVWIMLLFKRARKESQARKLLKPA